MVEAMAGDTKSEKSKSWAISLITWAKIDGRRAATTVGGVIVGALIVAFLGFTVAKFVSWQGLDDSAESKARIDRETEMIKTVAPVAGGLLLAVGVYYTWRRTSAIERNVEVAQEGQITERYTRAIDQLGSDSLVVRLEGIYALERIAFDSTRDHWYIMEVLAGFVRVNAPLDGDINEEDLPVDIQAAITVIGRLDIEQDA